MSRAVLVFRMSLGGAICGGFLGILAGVACGVVYGAWRGDVSLGLDGALLGGGALAVAGALYGAVLGWAERGSSEPVSREGRIAPEAGHRQPVVPGRGGH